MNVRINVDIYQKIAIHFISRARFNAKEFYENKKKWMYARFMAMFDIYNRESKHEFIEFTVLK